MDLGPIHGNAYTLSTVLGALVYGPITNTNYKYQYENKYIEIVLLDNELPSSNISSLIYMGALKISSPIRINYIDIYEYII